MQPPCVVPGTGLNACAKRLYAEKVQCHIDLPAPWNGWKLRGRILITPDGRRINALRIEGMIFEADNVARVSRARRRESGLQGEVIDLRAGFRNALDRASSEPSG